MKVQNRETGGIGNLIVDKDILRVKTDAGWQDYSSLAELNAEWEDYEEPKEHWAISHGGVIFKLADWDNKNNHEEIGNYFSSEEEAKLAIEKLKAWKRLKDDGCKPIMWGWKQDCPNDACYVEVVLKCQFDSGVHDKELDLLFGGEE